MRGLLPVGGGPLVIGKVVVNNNGLPLLCLYVYINVQARAGQAQGQTAVGGRACWSWAWAWSRTRVAVVERRGAGVFWEAPPGYDICFCDGRINPPRLPSRAWAGAPM